jgi:hypothetical protein
MRNFYAIQWYANAVHANTGKRCGRYFRFTSADARNIWVDSGATYRGDGFREVIYSTDRELRQLMRSEHADVEIELLD